MSGEKPRVRDTIDKMTKRGREQGLSSEAARKKAIESARRWDQRERNRK